MVLDSVYVGGCSSRAYVEEVVPVTGVKEAVRPRSATAPAFPPAVFNSKLEFAMLAFAATMMAAPSPSAVFDEKVQFSMRTSPRLYTAPPPGELCAAATSKGAAGVVCVLPVNTVFLITSEPG
jgi:hypothetical protein